MVERKAWRPRCGGTAAVTLLALVAFCCSHSRDGSVKKYLRFLLGSTDRVNSGGAVKVHQRRQQQRHQEHQQESLLDGATGREENSRFLETAAIVNMTITKEEEGVGRGEERFAWSDFRFHESRGELGGGIIDMEKLRGRCFVLEGEERTRCHPNVFFFGVSKCGTTSMAKWMVKHPQLRWVTRVKSSGKQIKPGQEGRALQIKTLEEFASKYPLTAPEAAETEPVVDCEFVVIVRCGAPVWG